MNNKISLFKYLYSVTAMLLIFFCITFMSVNIYINYNKFVKESKILKQKYIKNKKKTLKAGVEHFIELIKYNKNKIEKQKKIFLKKRIDIAYNLSEQLYKKYKDTKSTEEIKNIIIEALRTIRFEDDGSYNILDMDANVILSTIKPEYEGTNALEMCNLDGVFVAREKISLIKKQSEGFYSYMWNKPNNKDKEFEKISYIKLFKPFRWILSTGIYKDEVRKKVQEYVLSNIKQMEFNYDEKNYIFMGQWDGLSLSYPAVGKNMYDIQDKNGLYIVRELIKKAKEGGGFIEYVMPSLENEKLSKKMSYAQGIPEWQWYIGAGEYIDDINKDIEKLKNSIKEEVIETTVITLLILLLIMMIFIYIHFKLNIKVKKDFALFIEFLNSLLKSNIKINRDKIKIKEFDLIAKHANFMLRNKIKLEKNLELYKHIVNTAGDFLSLTDRNYKYLAVNETYLKFFDKKIEDIEGKTGIELFGKDEFEQKIKPLQDRALAGESFVVEIWVKNKQEHVCLQVSYFPHYQDKNEALPFGFVVSAKNITKTKIIEEKLKLWAKVFENTSEAVMICNSNKRIISVNNAFSRITGYKEEEVIDKSSTIIQSSDVDFLERIFHLVEEDGYWSGEVQNMKKSGEEYPSFVNLNVEKDERGHIINYIVVFSDITKLKNSEKMLSFLAHHDTLTKLPNRILLKDRITHAISNAKRLKNKVAICFIDLDNFKKINDSYGHSYGDEMLLQVAKRIKDSIRDADTLSRIGGDEFVLLLENVNDESDIEKTLIKIQKLLDDKFIIKTQKFFISASIGISLYPNDSMDIESLIKNADIAMYSAKKSGKNTYKFFTKKMSVDSFKMVNIESDLKDAIRLNQFLVYYQPQVNLKTKKVVGLEALVRWDHPKDGLISPDKFINYAEETKMIVQIGEFVLQQSCADLVKLQNDNNYDGNISINVSGVQIEYSDFSKTLKNVIAKTKINPSYIELEVTESTIMNDPSMWINLLSTIQKSGIKIAIDDFGTGYSSLSYLQKLPIDKLKIDMSFVRDIPKDENACSIANSIINLSEGMRMSTIAEGIETKEQEEFLEKSGCNEGQGYLYAKPMHMEDLIVWLNNYEQ